MKKLICLVLSAILFSACASQEASAPTSEAPVESADAPASDDAGEAPAEPADGVKALTGTINLGIWPEDSKLDEIAMHEGFVKTFNAMYPDVEIVPSYYKYAVDTFVSLAESGNVPTLFESWYTEPDKLISGGFIADITQQMADKGLDKVMNPAILDLLSRDGKIYGLPRDGYALGLYLNLELFEEAGLMEGGLPKYPKTMQELAETAKAIKDATGMPGFIFLAKDNNGGWHFSNIAWNFGAELQTTDGTTWKANLNSPEAVAAMEWVKSLKWEYDVLTADPLNEDWGTGFTQLGTGGGAMLIAGSDAVDVPTYQNGLPADKLSIVPIPAGPSGDQYLLMGGSPYFFAKDATPDEIEAGLYYLEIMGKLPVVSPESLAGLKTDAQRKSETGIPIIPRFPAWVSPEYKEAEDAANAEYANIDMRLYQDFYDAVEDGKIKLEEPKETQDMYAELTKVIQSVLTEENSDVQALMDTANANFQSILDERVNTAS
jgi:ABC-type glycerol-3-phosphate transport system substrate-binding protein